MISIDICEFKLYFGNFRPFLAQFRIQLTDFPDCEMWNVITPVITSTYIFKYTPDYYFITEANSMNPDQTSLIWVHFICYIGHQNT